jgi:hypothetical protein
MVDRKAMSDEEEQWERHGRSRTRWSHAVLLAAIWLPPSAVLGRMSHALRALQGVHDYSLVTSWAIDFVCLNNAWYGGPVLLVLLVGLAVNEVILTFARPAKCRMLSSLLWVTSAGLLGLLQWPFFIKMLVLPVSRWGEL